MSGNAAVGAVVGHCNYWALGDGVADDDDAGAAVATTCTQRSAGPTAAAQPICACCTGIDASGSTATQTAIAKRTVPGGTVSSPAAAASIVGSRTADRRLKTISSMTTIYRIGPYFSSATAATAAVVSRADTRS